MDILDSEVIPHRAGKRMSDFVTVRIEIRCDQENQLVYRTDGERLKSLYRGGRLQYPRPLVSGMLNLLATLRRIGSTVFFSQTSLDAVRLRVHQIAVVSLEKPIHFFIADELAAGLGRRCHVVTGPR